MRHDREVNATDAPPATTGTVPTDSAPVAPAVPDPVLARAVDVALEALREDVGDNDKIGDHLGVVAEASASGAVATHSFAAKLDGYVGWHWAISVSRTDDSDHVTICETVLLPGDGAIKAAPWVPWNERLLATDVHPGDVVRSDPDDDRLVPAYVLSDDPAVEEVAYELGLGRERVMSRDGRSDTATRWESGTHGPGSAMAKHAPAHCGTCGFYLPLAGSLGALFGACGNEVSPADGAIVTADFGCGAHSEATISAEPDARVEQHPVYDSTLLEVYSVRRRPDLSSLPRPAEPRDYTDEQREIMSRVRAAAIADRQQRVDSGTAQHQQAKKPTHLSRTKK